MFIASIVEIEIQQGFKLDIRETLSQEKSLEASALYLNINEIKKQKSLE